MAFWYEVMAAWKFTTAILESWKSHPIKNLPVYEAGTWGPAMADALIERDGRKWIRL